MIIDVIVQDHIAIPSDLHNNRGVAAAPSQPASVKIPFSTNQPRRPANIPLHTLNSSQKKYTHPSASGSPQEKRPLRRSSLSEDDEDSDWTDTGDLVDQLAEQEDPLHIALANEVPSSKGVQRHQRDKQRRTRNKRVHYLSDEFESETEKQSGVVKRKEDIPIPNPPPRKIPFGERLLVLLMAPNDGPSRLHGLHGKKLMYYSINH